MYTIVELTFEYRSGSPLKFFEVLERFDDHNLAQSTLSEIESDNDCGRVYFISDTL